MIFRSGFQNVCWFPFRYKLNLAHSDLAQDIDDSGTVNAECWLVDEQMSLDSFCLCPKPPFRRFDLSTLATIGQCPKRLISGNLFFPAMAAWQPSPGLGQPGGRGGGGVGRFWGLAPNILVSDPRWIGEARALHVFCSSQGAAGTTT